MAYNDNHNLKYPKGTDFYNVEDFNKNFSQLADDIDSSIDDIYTINNLRQNATRINDGRIKYYIKANDSRTYPGQDKIIERLAKAGITVYANLQSAINANSDDKSYCEYILLPGTHITEDITLPAQSILRGVTNRIGYATNLEGATSNGSRKEITITVTNGENMTLAGVEIKGISINGNIKLKEPCNMVNIYNNSIMSDNTAIYSEGSNISGVKICNNEFRIGGYNYQSNGIGAIDIESNAVSTAMIHINISNNYIIDSSTGKLYDFRYNLVCEEGRYIVNGNIGQTM